MKDYYEAALKEGQKRYRECQSRSEYPYLPVLEEMLPVDRLSTGTDLGLVQIPVEFIVGTKSSGRTHSFAANFMPIAEQSSEFASKWIRLCQSHLEEGIRDPVKAYEYMNRYYIEEGNKRVSVLKFFGAVTVPGYVTRILPERDGSDEVELYYEAADFYQITRINFLEFSRRGSYRRFLRLMGRETRADWDEEDVKKLRTDYYYFSKAYREQGGDHLNITVGDALLAYISIYGYENLRDKNQSEIGEVLSKFWKEIALVQEEQPISVIEDPGREAAPGLLSRIIPIIPKARPHIKAAFLYNRQPDHSNWVLSHEKGRLEVEKRLEGQLETKVWICHDDESAEKAMREAIEEGAGVIFATAAEMLNVCLKVAIDHPEVYILNCSLNVSHRYIRTYYPRMYEAKFISGAIAGAMCSNGRIGYICNYPVFGNIAEINAFARGVQLTNASAKVYLEWSDDSSLLEKADKLAREDVRLISIRDRSVSGDQVRVLYGLQEVGDNGEIRILVLPVWKWAVYYEKIIKSILDGSFHEQEEKSAKSLNYFWGMSSDVVGIEFSEELPKGVRYLGELIYKAIRMGVLRPFYDPVPDETGRIVWENVKASINMEEIIGMDWLEPNIIGSIPHYDQLGDTARKLVDVIGVRPARKDADELP